jgi:hypothetical protein
MQTKIIITGGGGVTGRAIARSIRLSEHFKTAVLISSDIYQNEYGLFEGLYDKCYKLPHVDHSSYLLKFEELISLEKPDVVLIMTEKEVIFWGTNQPNFNALISPFAFSTLAGNKARLYEALRPSMLVPEFSVFDISLDSFGQLYSDKFNGRPVWIRCYEEGTSSGKGAYLVKSIQDASAWFDLNPTIKSYLISDVLPGRNFACNVLFKEGKLLQSAIYERLEYFMPQLSPSGITGNIAVGKLINDRAVFENSIQAIRLIEQITSTKANGIYTVDLKGDSQNIPLITEINLRHTAATGSFAQGGCNMAEFQILASIGKENLIPSDEIIFPSNNKLLRDIDGSPVYLADYESAMASKLFNLS